MKKFIFYLSILVSVSYVFSSFEDCGDYVLTKAGKFAKSTIPIGEYSEKEAYKFWIRLIGEPYLELPLPYGCGNVSTVLSKEVAIDLKESSSAPQCNSNAYRRTLETLYCVGCCFSGLSGYDQVEVQPLLARKWLYRSAVHGYLPAQHMLGVLWLKEQAERGVVSANYYYWYWASEKNKRRDVEKYFDYAVLKKFPLALIQKYERLDSQDSPPYAEIEALLLSAAKEGSGVACAKLGELYYRGRGIAAALQSIYLSSRSEITLNTDSAHVVKLQLAHDISDSPETSELGILKDHKKARYYLKESYASGSILGKVLFSEYFPEEVPAEDKNYYYPEPLDTHLPSVNETLIDYIGKYLPEVYDRPEVINWGTAFDYGNVFAKHFDTCVTRQFCFSKDYTGDPRVDFPHVTENLFDQDSVFVEKGGEEDVDLLNLDASEDPLEKVERLKSLARAGEYGEEARSLFYFLGGLHVKDVWLEPPGCPKGKPKWPKPEVVL